MTKVLFTTAFLLGAFIVAWMALDFVGTDSLALMVTLVIGAVYIIGFIEQVQFRRATFSLQNALNTMAGPVEDLDQWIRTLHGSLQNSVRLRIEGERVALPLPVLTPYLVGLLVMLGLMGTFVGMVVTLKGAVIALEGTTELQAIREGLTAPIGGLGLAFGTSVAGVAASAMLGLISTISRRERIMETSRLDAMIAGVFRNHSLVHNRQETYKALQYQAQALPEVAQQLQSVSQQLQAMGSQLASNLTQNQAQFQQTIQSNFSELADSVADTLRHSLEQNGKLAGESIQPVVQATMDAIKEETQQTYAAMGEAVQQQTKTLAEQFTQTASAMDASWQAMLERQGNANGGMIEKIDASFEKIAAQIEQANQNLVQNLEASEAARTQAYSASDSERLALWADRFEQLQRGVVEEVKAASSGYSEQMNDTAQRQQVQFEQIAERLQQVSDAASNQQRSASNYLEQTAKQIAEQTQAQTESGIEKVAELLNAMEALVNARMESEKGWLDQQKASTDAIAQTLETSLLTLIEQEQIRSDAAVARLADLEQAVTQHLSSLGQSLEEPMNRLFETASQAPKAAAEVIAQLRSEISNNIERDNAMLEERQRIMDELNTLLSSIESTSSGQREAIHALVNDSSTLFKEVTSHISKHVNTEVTKIAEVANQFSSSSIEIASLGDAFSAAVQVFNESNQALMESLGRIEQSLDSAQNRSDEQLSYYIAQAREIIDHSMMSQKEILEEMRHLSRQPDLFAEEVE